LQQQSRNLVDYSSFAALRLLADYAGPKVLVQQKGKERKGKVQTPINHDSSILIEIA
jgi:hypothetical protein